MNPNPGLISRFRTRLFGERDQIERQLDEVSKQGSGMARAAHACALLLICLFSLGSLVALGGDALASIVAEWHHGQVDIPSVISIAVSTLLVLCMDVGMIYAASMLRRLAARRADPSETRIHQAVIGVVAVLEASTYAYMSARYEHPASLVVWALILARAAAAPLLSVYLSMARTIPISARDVLYQAELIAGRGVLRHVTELANNPEASLSELLAMYRAAGDTSETDDQRLVALIAAVQPNQVAIPTALSAPSSDGGPTHPTGPGAPIQLRELPADEADDSRTVALERRLAPSTIVPLQPAAERRPRRRRPNRFASLEDERQAAFALLDKNPNLSRDALRNRLHISSKKAGEHRVAWQLARQPQQHQADRRLLRTSRNRFSSVPGVIATADHAGHFLFPGREFFPFPRTVPRSVATAGGPCRTSERPYLLLERFPHKEVAQ